MIRAIYKFLPHFIKKKIVNNLNKNYLFVGWNLKTKTCPPWKNTITQNKILQISCFNDLNEELIEKINKNNFLLNQKNNENKNKIYELKWRHYNVLLSLKYLMELKKEKINLVEAGVADGLTAWFALSFLEKENIKYDNFTLIDSWEQMDSSLLKKNESKQIGRYENNNIEITKKNLEKFKKTNFLKGFIPNVLEKYKEKNMIDWLHIDLNSSIATKEILEFFSHRLTKNSIVLFDDYGWPNHEESRIEIDKWSINKSGILWPLPTGQAIFFNF
tara:strand:+ start:364 stop:1185 length:822 start_codon:yes stop_codon:yes gene_type:complete